MKDKYLKQIRNVVTVISVILICAVLKVTASVSINVLLAVFLFFLVYPLLHGLDKIKCPSWISLILTILLIIFVILLAFEFFIFTIDLLIRTLPGYSSRLGDIEQLILKPVRKVIDLPEGFSLFMNIDWIGTIVVPALRRASASAVTIVKNGFVVILMAIFLLLERNSIIPKLEEAAEGDNKAKVQVMWERINHQVSKYLGLKLLISAATGVLFYIIARIVKLDFASVWGVMAFIMNFIPTFGSIIITTLTIVMAVLQFFPVWTPIFIVAIGTVATQMILGNIIDPRLQGNQLNLSPFVILVSLSVFGYIFGVVGMFLAVPLLSILEIVMANMEGTRGIAIMLSSDKSLRKRYKANSQEKKTDRFSDITLPENKK